MMKSLRSYLLLLLIFFAHCAGKAPALKDASIRTVQKLNVGMISLNNNDFNEAMFFNCLQELPSINMISKGSVEQKLTTEGLGKQNLIQTLPKQGFEPYENIQNFSLLLLTFRNQQNQNYVRLVNFLSKQTRTIQLEANQLTCENILSVSRLLVVDSHPPFADVFVNDRLIGEAPVWTSLKDGNYDVTCKLPEQTFGKTNVQIPGQIQILCRRENQTTSNMEEDEPSLSEKTGGALIYIVGGAAAVAAGIVPYLLLK